MAVLPLIGFSAGAGGNLYVPPYYNAYGIELYPGVPASPSTYVSPYLNKPDQADYFSLTWGKGGIKSPGTLTENYKGGVTTGKHQLILNNLNGINGNPPLFLNPDGTSGGLTMTLDGTSICN